MCTKRLVSQLCVLGLVLVFVQAGKVTVWLTLISYSNPTGRDWLNQRCDERGSTAGKCDTYLKLCLDKPTGIYRGYTSDLNDCSFYNALSARCVGHSPIFTDINVGFPNPLEYNISDWQGGFQVKVVTYDDDKFTPDDVVDVILYKYEDLPAKSLQEAESGIIENVLGQRQDAQTSLKFNLVVSCSEFYYYPTAGGPSVSDPCSLYCKPEDSSTGHYNCTATGQKICLSGWMNEASNCLVPTNIETETTTNTPTVITGPGVDTAEVIGTGVFFGDNRNLIIGLMVGLFLLLLILVLLIALLLRDRRKRLREENDTAVAVQQTTTTASNSAVTATHDNPLYLNQANSTLAESAYSDVDNCMVKMPLGGSCDLGAITDAVAEAKEAGDKTDSYYNRNINYYVLEHRNHNNP